MGKWETRRKRRRRTNSGKVRKGKTDRERRMGEIERERK